MSIGSDPAALWAAVIALAILTYVALNGFDLGVGILLPLLGGTAERDAAMSSVAPGRDGDGVWLNLAGGALFAAFSLAGAGLMPALCPVAVLMVAAFVLRGVASGARRRAATPARRHLSDRAVHWCSLIAALAQGLMLGAMLDGLRLEGRVHAGGAWDRLSTLALLTGAALVAGYALLGATWLVLRTQGVLNARARRLAFVALAATLAAMAAVGLAAPTLSPRYPDGSLGGPGLPWVAPVSVLLALLGWFCWERLRRLCDRWPFPAALGLVLLGIIGLGLSAGPWTGQRLTPVGLGVLTAPAVVCAAMSWRALRGRLRQGTGCD